MCVMPVGVRVFVRVCAGMCVRALARVCVFMCVRARPHALLRKCVRVRACVRACACVCVCVYAWGRARRCVSVLRVCARAFV